MHDVPTPVQARNRLLTASARNGTATPDDVDRAREILALAHVGAEIRRRVQTWTPATAELRAQLARWLLHPDGTE